MIHAKLILFVILIGNSVSIPVSVQSGGSVLDEHSQHKNGDIFEASTKKGISGGQTTSGFNQENAKKHSVAQDSGSFNQENKDKNIQENSGERHGENYYNQNAGSVNQVGRQGGHRKGFHKNGFHNSYHKDESENNSSYYDDGEDQDGHFAYDSRDGAYGNLAADRNQGSYEDGRISAKGNAQRGRYDTGGNYGNVRGNANAYNNQQYYNDQRDLGKSNIGNSREEAGRHYEDRYYQQPYYQKYQPRKTITVYEDPRVYDRGYASRYAKYPEYDPGYDSEIHLDYRREPLPYYSREPYDYYY